MNAAAFARHLRARRAGRGKWMAKCPNHRDRQPSLSIREGQRGVVLVYCFAGCRTADVIAAAGLKWSDLFEQDKQAFFERIDHLRFRPPPKPQPRIDPKQDRYHLLRDQWKATAWEYRWLDKQIGKGAVNFIRQFAEHEAVLDELHRELCALEREGYHHAR